MKKHLWWMGVAVLALGLVGQLVTYYYRLDGAKSPGHAIWAFQPNSFNDVVNKAQTIVQGQVMSVQPGPDIVTSAKGEPNGEDRIPTEQIRIRVDSVDKGTAS